MSKSFSASVEDFVRKSKLRSESVFRTALQAVANEANTPRGQGGLMPVETSFLMNSQTADTNRPPSGPSVRGEQMGNPDSVTLTLAGAAITDIVYIGWTAEYARHMNHRFAFRDAAAQKWQQRVNEAVAEAKRRIP